MIKRFLREEDGMGVVEVLLIMVVLIAMVTVFKAQIASLVEKIWGAIHQGASGIFK